MSDCYDYVRSYYGVPVIIGARVKMKDRIVKQGVVVRKRGSQQYVYVRFDGQSFASPVHPTDLDYEVPDAPDA